MTKPAKYILITVLSLSALGVGYYIYSKAKIDKLNKKVSSLNEAYDAIDAIDTSGIVIPADASTEPDVPLYSGSDDNIDSTSSSDTGTYGYTPYNIANSGYAYNGSGGY